MRQSYHLSDMVAFGIEPKKSGNSDRRATRVDLIRPDGSAIHKDWRRGAWKVKVDQLGTWSWQLYQREQGITTVESSQFEVLPRRDETSISSTVRERLTRWLRRG